MVDILKDKPLEKNTKDIYGEAIDKLEVETDSIILVDDDRVKVLQYCKRKYKNERLFTTRDVDGKIRLYRTK